MASRRTPASIMKKFAASSNSSGAQDRSGAASSPQLLVGFTRDVATAMEQGGHAEENREGIKESDTDVGSHDGDDDDDDDDDSGSFVDYQDYQKYEDSLVWGERASPPSSVSRVGSKVRRLNLDDFHSGSVGEGSPRRSPTRKRGGGRQDGRQFPMGRGKEHGDEKGISACPAAVKKGSVSTKFSGKGNEKKDVDDISPRDVIEFPFFSGDTPEKGDEKKKKKLQRRNLNLEGFQLAGSSVKRVESREDLTGGELVSSPPQSTMPKKLALTNTDTNGLISAMASATSPRPTPTRKKKPVRPRVDLNDTSLLMGSPPKGLRSVGRANSFMQMFSQGVITVGVDEESNDDKDEIGSFAIRRPMAGTESLSQEDAKCPIPSPRRPLHGHTCGPASSACNGNTSTSFSRFVSDFEVVGTLGNGSFGCVYKVRNRTDQRKYAVKAAKREAKGVSDRNRMLQEVYALAALSDHVDERGMHVVRYHQAWMELNRLYIQTELCESTMPEEIKSGKLRGEKRRYKLLREMLLALDLVHKSGMIHLDIKPENIFIKNDQYKLGDFGLVSKISSREVEEGDSRYLSLELLSDDHGDLTKSDIFSLGATMYEVCLDRYPQSLPENGPEWHDIRRGILLPMVGTRHDLQTIVCEMMAPDCLSRPSAEELLKRRQLLSEGERQLIAEKNRTAAANMALDAQLQRFKLMSPANLRKKFHRSNTIC